MDSYAVSSSHGRQAYGTAPLAPEELRGAHREVAGRREAGPGRGRATPADVRRSSPDRRASGAGPVHGRAQERRPRSFDRRRDCNRGCVPQRRPHYHAAHARRYRARLHAHVQVRSPARHRGGSGHQAVPDQGPDGHEQYRPHWDDEGGSRVGGVGRDQDAELHRGGAQGNRRPCPLRNRLFWAVILRKCRSRCRKVSGRVHFREPARGPARREALRPAILVHRLRDTVDPAVAQRLFHRVVVGDARLAAVLLIVDQPDLGRRLVMLLELGTQDSLLQRVGEKELGIAAAQELGKQREVGAVFAGHLKVTNPKGTGGLAGLVTPHLEATVKVELAVRLLSTRSGATLWRASAWATERVGHVALVAGQLDFSAKDPKEAYGPLVNTLIRLVTQDLRSTWQQQ